MRPRELSALKPPKITVCGAPIRAQAKQRNHQLGNQRHVDSDDVTLLHTQILEHVCELRYFPQQVLVPQHPALARLALPDDRRLVAVGPWQWRSMQL